MNGNVIIKSFPNGISVKLSDEPDFEKILPAQVDGGISAVRADCHHDHSLVRQPFYGQAGALA